MNFAKLSPWIFANLFLPLLGFGLGSTFGGMTYGWVIAGIVIALLVVIDIWFISTQLSAPLEKIHQVLLNLAGGNFTVAFQLEIKDKKFQPIVKAGDQMIGSIRSMMSDILTASEKTYVSSSNLKDNIEEASANNRSSCSSGCRDCFEF